MFMPCAWTSLHSGISFQIWVIHQLNANAHQFSTENAINSAQDFYRVKKPNSSIERKYFGKLPVEVAVFTCIKARFFLLVDLQEFFSDLGSGGRKKNK